MLYATAMSTVPVQPAPIDAWVPFFAALAGALVGGGLSFVAQLLTYKHEQQVRREQRVLEEAKERKIDEAAERERRIRSDAACWRRIRDALDDLAWETKLLGPGTKPAPGGGLMFSSLVDVPTPKWGRLANKLLRATDAVSFFHEPSQRLLGELHTAAQAMAVEASMANWLRREDAAGANLGIRPMVNEARDANERAARHLQEFQALYARIKDAIRDSVGFDRLGQAEAGAGCRPSLRATPPSETGDARSPQDSL